MPNDDDEVAEQEIFIEDTSNTTTPAAKNKRLAGKLSTSMVDLLIVRIERIEIGFKGWRVVHRVPADNGG